MWIWLHSHAETRQLTHDQAMIPVSALATFGISQLLAGNVGIVATRADMLQTYPTKCGDEDDNAHLGSKKSNICLDIANWLHDQLVAMVDLYFLVAISL